LVFTNTVAKGVIGKTLKRYIRMVLSHPPIERIIEKEIRQQGGNSSTYAKGNFQFERVVTGWRTQSVLDLRLKT
jgi:hypothetical protein